MNKAQKKEIRAVLLGKTGLTEDGRVIALGSGFHLSAGVADGAGAVRFLGIAKREYCFATKRSPEKTLEAARTAMFEIGRGLVLRETPDAEACLIRYILTKPVVLVFRYVGDVPVLTALTGRSLTGWISMWRAKRAFADELPDDVVLTRLAAPQEPTEPSDNTTEEEVPEQ